jgi:predicted enzyme related to lactoylglutathione lyase
MGYPIVHFEIMGQDHEGLRDFYTGVFGWEHDTEQSIDDYHMMATAEGSLAGGIGKGPDEMPNYLTMYVLVPDIDAQLEKVEANGGETLVPRTEIPDIVTFALFRDPAGNMLGLVEGEPES